MSTMEFDDSQFKLRSRKVLGEPQVPPLIRFLVTKGIVKSETQAIVILLVCIVVIIATSVFVARSYGVTPATLDAEYVLIQTKA